MLMDGALERIATARGCMQRGDTAEKAVKQARTNNNFTQMAQALSLYLHVRG